MSRDSYLSPRSIQMGLAGLLIGYVAFHDGDEAKPYADPVAQSGYTAFTATSAPTAQYVYYRNCSAARSAGAAPVMAGEPGYGGHLDRDGDGVGCE